MPSPWPGTDTTGSAARAASTSLPSTTFPITMLSASAAASGAVVIPKSNEPPPRFTETSPAASCEREGDSVVGCSGGTRPAHLPRTWPASMRRGVIRHTCEEEYETGSASAERHCLYTDRLARALRAKVSASDAAIWSAHGASRVPATRALNVDTDAGASSPKSPTTRLYSRFSSGLNCSENVSATLSVTTAVAALVAPPRCASAARAGTAWRGERSAGSDAQAARSRCTRRLIAGDRALLPSRTAISMLSANCSQKR
mmetsp:Transcript_8461/g.27835  ORF Transcript_8461/g.27835 Transcript_8461/m.27835 type:complete len:258 (+) Transcript_8461:1613-2386(+)